MDCTNGSNEPSIMEPTMVLAYDPWDQLFQLWKDQNSQRTEWRKVVSITETELKLGIKLSN